MNTLDEIRQLAQQHGLVVRGGFVVDEADNVPCVDDGIAAVTLVLFGNAGSSLWRSFTSSKEYADGLPDPLNRWSERIGAQIASQLSGRALFPFGGSPYQPFIGWAKKSESLQHSKIGMLIHPQYGLWHAYRFAVALPELISGLSVDDFPARESIAHDICQRCVDQPCLNTCPVGAFTPSNYDVAVCYAFLKGALKQDLDMPSATGTESGIESGTCRKGGCQARMACPEGHEFRYHTEHARFHMDAFFASISKNLEN